MSQSETIHMNICWEGGEKDVHVTPNESDIYQAIGKCLLELSVPNKLVIFCDGRMSAEYDIIKRGTFKRDGVTQPSMYVVEKENSINIVYGLNDSDYPETYLTCVNPQSNNYKFYHMKPRYDGVHATYGRIGSRRGEAFGVKDLSEPFPRHMFWIRYYEKLSKGYTDQSDIYLDKNVVASKTNERKDKLSTPSIKLYDMLLAYAKHVVRETLNHEHVTAEQVAKCREILNKMREIAADYQCGKYGEAKSAVSDFSDSLEALLALSPRRARFIGNLFPRRADEFADIIDREENLLSAMGGVASADEHKDVDDPFASLGIQVFKATKEQEEKVLNRLSPTLASKVKNVYRVINGKHKERFDKYLAAHKIKTVKELWHGSKNENWLSILTNGLLLNPNAIITGKMFGDGIYFAPSSMKSWNYTSYYGTTWANGNSDRGFMGLYAVGYGTPLDVHAPASYNQARLASMGKNCVHAHAGQYLLNDEIIFYDEAAILLNYIVEFA